VSPMPRPFLFRRAFSPAMSHAHASLALRVFLQIHLVCAESCWLGGCAFLCAARVIDKQLAGSRKAGQLKR